MNEFDYKKIAKEIGWNFSKIEIKTEQDVDFDYYEEVAKNINKNTVMLDIGCGSADKSSIYFCLFLKYSSFVNSYIFIVYSKLSWLLIFCIL